MCQERSCRPKLGRSETCPTAFTSRAVSMRTGARNLPGFLIRYTRYSPMKLRTMFLAAAAAALWAAIASSQAPPAPAPTPAPVTPLPWAYPINPPAPPQPPSTDPTLRHVPKSIAAFTQAQVTDGFNPPDWHPEGHPRMPDIVGHGRRPDVRACGYCH